MLLDLLTAVLRGLGFLAVLQAGGAALFLAVAGRGMTTSRHVALRLIRVAALIGLALLLAQFLLQPARMAGGISGMWNPALLNFTLHSRAALALALQLAGLLLLLLALRRNGAGMRHFGVTGAVLIAGSFAATGHTSDSPERWLLGPFLALHLLIVEFWFGALLPLLLVTRHEPAAVAARIVQRFSRLATWTVPLILLAGVLIAARLLPDFGALLQPYGLGLSLKLLAFALLMGLAAVNRWRLAPALEHGGSAAARRLRDSVGTELVLIAAVLMGTATLTTFWSPGY